MGRCIDGWVGCGLLGSLVEGGMIVQLDTQIWKSDCDNVVHDL